MNLPEGIATSLFIGNSFIDCWIQKMNMLKWCWEQSPQERLWKSAGKIWTPVAAQSWSPSWWAAGHGVITISLPAEVSWASLIQLDYPLSLVLIASLETVQLCFVMGIQKDAEMLTKFYEVDMGMRTICIFFSRINVFFEPIAYISYANMHINVITVC